jgi:phospholipid/cholesterol/gamma-HCH transport system substrate-binding protein
MRRAESMRQLRAGIFLASALGLLVAAVFLLGRTQTLFAHRVRLFAHFQNASGVAVGAPVRLAGVDVGIIEAIRFDPDLAQRRVRLTLAIERRYLDRVREDSVACLTSKGLLGDMLVNITLGGADAKPLPGGATLRSRESEGLTEIVGSLQQAIGDVRTLSGTVGDRVNAVFTDQLSRDLGRTARAAAEIAEEVERGSGLLHTLVYDPRLSNDARRLLADGARTAQTADRALGRVERLLAAVEQGDGTLHGLIYRDDGGRLLGQLNKTAVELDQVIHEVRAGRGLAHGLIYGEDKARLLDDLQHLARTLRRVGDDVQAGRGTVGALLKDPSVYEDIKTIFGNLKRNRLLKTLVRYTIKKDGLNAR